MGYFLLFVALLTLYMALVIAGVVWHRINDQDATSAGEVFIDGPRFILRVLWTMARGIK